MRNTFARNRQQPGLAGLVTGFVPPVFGALMLLAVIAMIGCGNKSLPKPPESERLPPPVADVASRVNGDALDLSWTVPATTGEYPLPAAGFNVLAHKQSREEPCPNCPPRYKLIGQLKVLGRLEKAAGKQRMRYQYPLEPGYHYTIKVIAIGSDGTGGPDSNTIQIEH